MTTGSPANDIQRICTVNEVFLLRTLPGKIANETSQAKVIPLSFATCPSKAPTFPALGIEPNPFFVSILHPRWCREFRLCCASIGPVQTFCPDILRAALRVFAPPHCKAKPWTNALTWFWKSMEKSKGKKFTKGKQWIDTRGLCFWVSTREDLKKALNEASTPTVDVHLARTVLLDWLDDLLRRNYSPSPHLRHVLHTGCILDPGTFLPVFDESPGDNGLYVLCGIESADSDDGRALVQCYDKLFDDTGPLLHEAPDPIQRKAYTRLTELRIARGYSIGGRTLYFSPHRILPGPIEALCRPPCIIADAGPLGDRPLDQLARLLTFPIEDYFIVYDSTITADSPFRQTLLAQLEASSQDLATIAMETEDLPLKATMTARIQQVKSRVYRLKAGSNPLVARRVKTVFLLDFAKWRLRQLHQLCSCFATSRFMSRAHAAWVALNVEACVVSTMPVDPTEWTKDTDISCVLSWFDVNFIKE